MTPARSAAGEEGVASAVNLPHHSAPCEHELDRRARPARRRASRGRAAASCARSASRARSCRARSEPARRAGRARSRPRCGPSRGSSRASRAATSRRARGCRAAAGRRGGSRPCPSTGCPSATPEPESRAPSWAMKATSATRRIRTMRGHGARLGDAVDDRREHVAVVEAVDRLPDRVGEGGPDGDHDLRGSVPAAASPTTSTIAAASRSPAPSVPSRATCGSACSASQRAPSRR